MRRARHSKDDSRFILILYLQERASPYIVTGFSELAENRIPFHSFYCLSSQLAPASSMTRLA